MRTKAKTKTYNVRKDSGYFRLNDNDARLCPGAVQQAFDIGLRIKLVEFRVTNSKPKRLGGWHILRKCKDGHWRLTTAINSDFMQLLWEASVTLTADFPKNSTLYVSAYTRSR